MSETKTLDLNELNQFTGSENWYRHSLNRKVLFTDGAKYMADAAGAYWLLDLIALAQTYGRGVSEQEFQVWTLTVHDERKQEPWLEAAILTCEDGNGQEIYTRSIEYTDFPLPKMVLWFANGTIFLPSEY